ncbi:MAG: hypothetical protein KBD23_03900 [Gammaproteobacteria bacterium]|nr:hypothetical protein [Gammaproteobacteria bacterium]MBP9729265.1 hypothetical protein [Gammaproteobacteria bacterium]
MRLKTPLFLIALLIVCGLFSEKSFYHHATQETIKPSVVKQNKNITILSFATDPKHCMLKLLTASSPYPVEILGKNKKWRSHRDKLEAVKRYLSKKNLRNSDKIIMFVDGYDTFFAPGNQDIIKKFHSFHKPIVISAEIGCWPFHTPACIDKKLYPKSPTPFQYVNSGTYIGYASAIYKMLKEVLHDHPQQRDDQYMLHDYFINHPDRVALDYHQEIFSLLYETNLNNYHYDNQTGFISNLITHSTPVVFHGNGPFPVKQLLLNLHAMAYKTAGGCDNY